MDSAALLAEIMPVARLVLWEAWDHPLDLIALHFGKTDRPTLALEPAQMEPGTSWTENVYPSDREKLEAFLDSPDVLRPGKSVDYRLIVAEGELLWVRHWVLHRTAGTERRRRLQGMLMPIPEQKHLEWECLRVSERECNRIGQELHDDLCQVLSGVTFMMHVLAQRAAKVTPELGKEIEELNTHILGATDRVRSMAHGLFPARLNYTTLREALSEFARQTRTRFPVQLKLEFPRKLPPHSPEQIIHVYRIVQEAVSNAVRHGGAANIRVFISATAQELQMNVEDDGNGFPATSVRPEGIGMHVMQYRARMLGGSVRFKNHTPRGAAVQLTYPISHRAPQRGQKTDPLL
jgi:signal transduction histidine kinase